MKKYNNTIDSISTDQLFIDDISTIQDNNQDLQNILLPLNINTNYKTINWFKYIKQYEQQLINCINSCENIILPWWWSNIIKELILALWSQELNQTIRDKWIWINIKRKIAPWSLTPRWTILDEKWEAVLRSLINKKLVILDDVIASWSTMNSLFKKLQIKNPEYKKSYLDLFTLVAREDNDLKLYGNVTSFVWWTLSSVNKKYPWINTISTMVNWEEKSELIKSWFLRKWVNESVYDNTIKELQQILL